MTSASAPPSVDIGAQSVTAAATGGGGGSSRSSSTSARSARAAATSSPSSSSSSSAVARRIAASTSSAVALTTTTSAARLQPAAAAAAPATTALDAAVSADTATVSTASAAALVSVKLSRLHQQENNKSSNAAPHQHRSHRYHESHQHHSRASSTVPMISNSSSGALNASATSANGGSMGIAGGGGGDNASGLSPTSSPGHSRQASADVKFTPFNKLQMLRDGQQNHPSLFGPARIEPNRPWISQPCVCNLSCCTVAVIGLLLVGILTIIPPMVLTLGPQINANQNFAHSRCLVLADEVITVASPCGGVVSPNSSNQCLNYVPQFLVTYYPRGPSQNVTTYAYRKITDSAQSGGWTTLAPAQDYISHFRVGDWYTCWYNRKDDTQVVFDVSLDTFFWIGMALIIAVFVLCILLPLTAWFTVSAFVPLRFPDRWQAWVRTVFGRSVIESPQVPLPSEVRPEAGHEPFWSEKRSIAIPLPIFTSEKEHST